tara:strand:+ start:710 stop:1129 length:420 start_codon:yes stop_codon:yes gene_type:complete
MIIIDAKDLISGRMATFVAKQALLGETIDIVNAEQAVISGTPAQVLARYKQRSSRGIPSKGPFLPRNPDMFLKRLIRNMLPFKQDKGEKAFKRIKCHIGIPEEFKEKKIITLDSAQVSKLPNTRYITISRICKELGAKI